MRARSAEGADSSPAAPGSRGSYTAVHYFPILHQRRGAKDVGRGERETPSDHARLNFRVGGNGGAGAENDGDGGEEAGGRGRGVDE